MSCRISARRGIVIFCVASIANADTESERLVLGRFVNGDLRVGPKMNAKGSVFGAASLLIWI